MSDTKKVDMVHPAVGASLKGHICSFTVWAPFRNTMEIILQDHDASHPLRKDEDGYWTGVLEGIKEGTRYFFRLDGDKKLPDPASRAQPEGVHGPSMVMEQTYNWTDGNWKGLPMGDMVIYEIHVGTFTSRHDFNGVISKLPYLKNLGINAIEIMPVAQFPGNRNWGYDGVYPFAVQDSYGGPSGLKKLVNEAHRQGITVILDVVYNHQGPEGNYLGEYGPYFTDKYKTGWGRAINFDDAWCDGVRNYYWQNALMWLSEFHIDGLRLDAVHAIWDFSARHFIEELSLKVKALEKECGCKKILVAELDLNNPRYIWPFSKGGYGLDGQWIDEFHHALHALVTGEVNGYYEDFGEVRQLAKSFRESYVYTGQYSVHRKKLFGRDPIETTNDQFVVFAQNHDQVGNRMMGDRLTTLLSKEGLKLAAAAYLLAPQIPMLFMGEEYGEKNPFQYFISHTDNALVDLVRKGRKEEFSSFKWLGEVPDPQSGKTFEKCVLSWSVENNDPDAKILFSFYQHLIAFRKKRPAMRERGRKSLNLLSANGHVLCFERQSSHDRVLIILNFKKEEVLFHLPVKGKLKKILDSASTEWGGPGNERDIESEGAHHTHVKAQSVQAFEY